MRVGEIDVQPVYDGVFRVPPIGMFNKTEEQWAPHRRFLDDDGLLPVELGGFLVRTGERVMLVDAGLGPHDDPAFGHLLASLAALGVTPEDVTDVVLTHLHFDHVGWASDGERPIFANAVYRCDERDWSFFVGPEAHEEQGREQLGAPTATQRLAPVERRLETWSNDRPLAPGVDVRAAPGHTPGSTIVVLSSGPQRAMLLGDVVHCPAELLDDEWTMIADVDPALARRTREALARELEGTDIPVAASHFQGLQFGRLLPGEGIRQWRFDGPAGG